MGTVPTTTDIGELTPRLGWRAGVDEDGLSWVGLFRLGADDEVLLQRHPVEDPANAVRVLANLLDDAVFYKDDPDEPAAAVDPIPAEVLAALGQPLYTARLDLQAGDVLNPTEGPKWQIWHAVDEDTWCDVTEVVSCAKRDACEVWRAVGDCVVLVSSAYADGYAHLALDDSVTVRIPAATA